MGGVYRLPFHLEKEHAFAGLLTVAVVLVAAIATLLFNGPGGSTRLAADRGGVKSALSAQTTIRLVLGADGRLQITPRIHGAIKPGAYELRVRDGSGNDSLSFSGRGFDQSTGVVGKGLAVWRVHLEPGTYAIETNAGVRKLKVAASGW